MKTIGLPKETKVLEGRVALTPDACGDLIRQGLHVFVEHNAGLASGYDNACYEAKGATLCANAAELYALGELIVKVKEPTETDLLHLRAEHILFCYLHLAAEPDLQKTLCDRGLTAIGFETIAVNGALPLLAPMSAVAGRVAVQLGTHYLHKPQQGKGLLLGGVAGCDAGQVTVLGAGVAGSHAAEMAAAMGATVTVLDIDVDKLKKVTQINAAIETQLATPEAIARILPITDLLIGAVLVTGRKAPQVVSREMVASMPKGSVLVDISVDQGGCIETTHATSYDNPTYIQEGVVHCCVTNLPGGVPRTATQALSGAILPYVILLADDAWQENTASRNTALREGVNVAKGEVVLPALICEAVS